MAFRRARVIAAEAAFGLCASAGLVGYVVTVGEVTGASMHPTINPHLPARSTLPSDKQPGEWLIIERFSQRFLGSVRRGDVVCFVAPDDPRRLMIKRVIALPGDEVRPVSTGDGRRTLIVPEGRFWAEGDNPAVRDDGTRVSTDSNDRNIGPVPLGLLRGRLVGVVWPPSRFGVLMERREASPGRLVRMAPDKDEPGWRQFWKMGFD